MIADILVLDDEPILRDTFGRWLGELPARVTPLRLTSARVVLVRNASQAIEALHEAAARGQPFDVLLADLEVPDNDYSAKNVRAGLSVVSQAQAIHGARETLVTSGFLTEKLDDRLLFSHSLLNGATDLLPKDLRKGQFQDHVIRSLQRGLLRRSAAILAHRIRDLVPHAEHTLIYLFGVRFSRCIQDVGRAERTIRDEMLTRWNIGAENDPNDLLVQQLAEIHGAIDSGRLDWNQLRIAHGFAAESSPEAVDVQSVLHELAAELEPCLTTKRVYLDINCVSPVEIQSFDGDVRALLREMLLGSLAEMPDFGDKESTLSMSSSVEDDWMDLSLRDSLRPLTTAEATLVNEGNGGEPAQHFSRTWGLSIMQHVALRGGGRLTVIPDVEGNLTRYRVPLAHRA